jgi:CSLREA domain-containing protein
MRARPFRIARRPAAATAFRLVAALAVAAGGLVAVGSPALATNSTITVNSAADPGDGTCNAYECTLREAIAKANSSHGASTIRFAVGSGPVTISIASNFPTITKQLTIDGTSQPGYAGAPIVQVTGGGTASTGLRLTASQSSVKGLVINGFTEQQVSISGTGNTVSGSYLGTDAAGTEARSGGSVATVRITGSSSGNTLSGNVIGGGATGVKLDSGTSDNSVSDNFIGLGADGSSNVGAAGAGVTVLGSKADIRRNRIAFNGGLGIDLGGDGPDANDLGDADTGPNGRQNSPALTTVEQTAEGVEVAGTLNSNASGSFVIDVFANASCDEPSGRGEGRFYVGSLNATSDGSGDASFAGVLTPGTAGPPPDDFDVYTATATQMLAGAIAAAATASGKETSEFSECVDETPAFAAPSPPTGVAVGAGDSRAQVTWLAPDSDGGSPLDHYTVTSSPDAPTTPVDIPAGTLIANIPGLANGTPYTFTVTATNEAGLTSGPSAVSETVTPLAGTADPEAASADLGASGTLSTGSDASAADPTNTTVFTPNPGIVTIGESAITGTPPAGATYVGQQVDIDAPDASATDPMRFAFVVDCSALEPKLGPGSCPAADPPTSASVQVRDGSYKPSNVTVGQGRTVTWSWVGSRSHSVTDADGVGASGTPLYSSGTLPPGSTYSYTFAAAGSYNYKSKASGDPTSMKGTVSVPVEVAQPTGSTDTAIEVTWASAEAEPGYRFDVQYRYRAPGTTTYSQWKAWIPDPTAPSKTFLASALKGAGDYQFRTRLERSSTGRTSDWSPAASVTITAGDGAQHLAAFSVFHETAAGNTEVPDCTGPEGVAEPAPSCVWSETILPDGDLEIVVFTTVNGRWRAG